MANDLATTSTTKPAVHGMSTEQVDLIRRTIAAKATNDELALFIGLANRTGLDPFSRQIFLVPRKQKIGERWVETHQAMVSIDGARLVAQRSDKYRGQTPPEWCGEDGKWCEAWLDAMNPPAAARVGVYHADYPERPTYGVARYRSYVQTNSGGAPNATWHRMPDVMLAKCAEMLALRKAFQQDLGGLVIEEETGTDPVVLDAGTAISTLSTQPLPRTRATQAEEKLYVDAARAAKLTKREMSNILDAHGEGGSPPFSDQIPAILAAIEVAVIDDVDAVTDAEVVPDGQTELLS